MIAALLEAFSADGPGLWATLALLLDWRNMVAFVRDLGGWP